MTSPRAPFTLTLTAAACALSLLAWAPAPAVFSDILAHTPLSQLLHAAPRHLCIDALAFALLGLSFEPRCTTRRWALWTVTGMVVSWAAWLALYPHQRSLLGLSAINHFLLAAGLAGLAREWRPAWVVILLLLAHAGWETFVALPPLRLVGIDDIPGVSRVSAAHLIAAGAGVLAGMGRRVPDSRNQPLAPATN